MKLEEFKRIILDFQEKPLPELTLRSREVSFVKNMSTAIIGARRSGKTYRTYQFIQECQEKGVKKENFCRIQFNDHRIRGIKLAELSQIHEAYYALFPEKLGTEEVYFIFDEIHRVNGWEDYILHLLEERTHRVIITGSTSKLMTGDIASALRGKNFPCELFPFSFLEFIRHYDIPRDMRTTKGQAHLRKAFMKYLTQGGFPGLLDAQETQHIELLQTYWDTMVLRDIIEAHPQDNINITTFNYFAEALISRIGCPMTIRKIGQHLEEEALPFSAETLYRYLAYLEEAFMVFTLSIYSKSEKIRARNYRKVYAIDWALANAVAIGEGVDDMRKLENIVFIELKRRGYNVSYYLTRSGYEIDFVAIKKKKRNVQKLIQVCYSLNKDEVRNRELRGLSETSKFLKIKECLIITLNDEEMLVHDELKIRIVPIWKWLLEVEE